MTLNIIKQSFIIWGCGNRGKYLLKYLRMGGLDACAFIDNNCQLWDTYVESLPVISFAEYLEKSRQETILVSPVHYGDVIALLHDHGVDNWLLYRDVALLDFDNGVWAARDMVADAIGGAKKRYEERATLLEQFRAWNLSRLQFFWHKDLLLHEFAAEFEMVSMTKVLSKLRKAKCPIANMGAENIIEATNILCGGKLEGQQGILPTGKEKFDLLLVHGLRLDTRAHCLLIEARERNVPVIFEEDGFLRSIVPFDFASEEDKFRRPHALTLQEHGIYINAFQPSYMERLLESGWEMTTAEVMRARKCIARIRRERLSKYNHQPLSCPALGDHNREKVLVIDQVFGDKSIEYGLADDGTFEKMLEAALKDNPEAEIYVKTHPANDKGHYGDLQENGRIHLLREPMNPIALLEQMDKAYTCVSTMGFEALLCGCETHVFGMPFYAGWGITVDKLTCQRRTKQRSLEEVFYVAYVLASVYVSYEVGEQCEIEQAMDDLVKLRRLYFQEREKK